MKHIILAPFLAVAMSLPAFADKIALNQISGYLNSFKSAQADFTQINQDGSVTTGKILIKRPGRVRFDYAPPDDSLVIAGGGTVAVFDPKSNVPPQQFPLKRTPLNLILARKVDLSNAKMVVAHKADGPATIVKMQDPAHPEYGYIELKFTDNPVELRQWVITDDAGAKTTVVLGGLKRDVKLSAKPFDIPREVRKRGLAD